MSDAPSGLGSGRTVEAYDSASLDYQEASERFWKFLSLQTIAQLDLEPGGSVLDVACGPGVSTVAAAKAVGPQGKVVALDSSEQMLRMAGERAAAAGVENVELQLGDMAQLDFPAHSFEAVVSILGIFYVPDMPSLVSTLWRIVKPGGQLAVTTLGEGAFEPAFGIWKEEARKERPSSSFTFSWERTNDPDAVRSILSAAGVEKASIRLEERTVPISSAEDWWLAVMGSGMRRTILEMDDLVADRVKAECGRRLAEEQVTSVRMPGIYAMGTKP